MALLPVDDALKYLLEQVLPSQEMLKVDLKTAFGATLARDVFSSNDVPPMANSAMDGYAIRYQDLVEGASLPLSDFIPAGSVGKPLVVGTAARIFTGAALPPGADTVVIQEDVIEEQGAISLQTLPDFGENIRPAGQDISAGQRIFKAGRRLSPQDVSLLASIGMSQVQIIKPLTVAILSTGDELIDPPTPLQPGQIYNSNRYAMAGMLEQMGMKVIDFGVIADTAAATEAALTRAAEESDCIFSSGGVSVGELDFVKSAVEKLGRVDLWKLAIKPGKPLAFGQVADTPFFGLPGNPVSTFVTFIILAKPFLRALQGQTDVLPEYLPGTADFEFTAGSRREYLRVRMEPKNGSLVLTRFENQGSGVMSSVSWANALAEVKEGQVVKPGDRLRFLNLDRW
jgi:molybdopterin molybdotransferase